jgi:hypothetical protein
VTGLLEGIDFRKPGRYGLKQVWQIMEHTKNIMFVLTDHGKAASELALGQALSAEERESYSAVLNKIVDDEKVR